MMTGKRIANGLTVAVLLCVTWGTSSLAQVLTNADLRLDYDAHTPVNGQDSIGKIADTLGTGSWNLYGSATVGGALTALTYTTAASGSRGANCYIRAGQTDGLPAIANHAVYATQGGDPPAGSMALHPIGGQTLHYVVARWTAGAGSAGSVQITGVNFSRTFSPASQQNGTTIEILHNGTTIFGSTVVAAQGGSVSFDVSRTVSPGDTVDFVMGPNGTGSTDWYYDQTYLSARITGSPPAPEGGTVRPKIIEVTDSVGAIQWQASQDGATWSNLTGQTGATLDIASLYTNTPWFRVQTTVGTEVDYSTTMKVTTTPQGTVVYIQ